MVQMLRELAHLLVMVCWGPEVLEFMQASFTTALFELRSFKPGLQWHRCQ